MYGIDYMGESINDALSFPLTYHRLRFRCKVETPLHLGGWRAGSNLRGALVEVMRRATCTGDSADPAHLAECPVCWLVAANDHPGQERRGYVLTPPVGASEHLAVGETFTFHLTLLGSATRYLPYFVLALPEAGRLGVGPGRGRFRLIDIQAEHPLAGDWPVLQAGDRVVRPPVQTVSHTDLSQAAEALSARLETHTDVVIRFITPLRLIVDGRLLKSPDFGVVFARLLERLDDLAIQYAGGSPRLPEDCRRLWTLANQVRLVESHATWVDVCSGSSRSRQATWISGLVGPARYSAPGEVWRTLLPWLLWGQVCQVGKDTAKGNGVLRLFLNGDEE